MPTMANKEQTINGGKDQKQKHDRGNASYVERASCHMLATRAGCHLPAATELSASPTSTYTCKGLPMYKYITERQKKEEWERLFVSRLIAERANERVARPRVSPTGCATSHPDSLPLRTDRKLTLDATKKN